jgi:hypothetical protein
MARSCIELLDPHRYDSPSAQFLLAQARLAIACQREDEAWHAACGLLDLSGGAKAVAALAMRESAFLEGRTSRHALEGSDACAAAVRLAVDSGVEQFDCVVALCDGRVPKAATRNSLPGVWIAVTERPSDVPAGIFDVIVTARHNPTFDADRVFRMVVSQLAKETANCMDVEDFLDPLRTAPSCRLLDAFLLPGRQGVQLVSAEDEALLEKATGLIVIHQLVRGRDTLMSAKTLFDSIRDRAPEGIPATFHWPIDQLADLAEGPVRPIDVLVAANVP